MDKLNFAYSTKNIPSAPKHLYLKRLLEKTEVFLRRMRWKAFFHLNPEIRTGLNNNYGFESRRSPPTVTELTEFEDKLLNLVQNVTFTNKTNKFQQQLQNDLKAIKQCNKIIVKADKTNNFYKMKPAEYKMLVDKNIMQTYKKADTNSLKNINKQASKITKALEIDDRVEKMAEKTAFITLKDHKPSFDNNPTCRLINPAKQEIGKISKRILDRIINSTITQTKLNLWKNTRSVLNWYNDFPTNSNSSFICFDIIEFYPSITEQLLKRALDFAKQYDNISDEEINIIISAKSSIIFNGTEPWRKRDSDDPFDVTMGSYDGAESCELVVCYMLSLLNNKYGNHFGLYRDDGLGLFNEPPKKVEKIKQDITKIFNKHGLRITIDANKRVVDFLDVTLNLYDKSYKPYMKANNAPLYVNAQSNHPPVVLKNLPENINNRLSEISIDSKRFNEAIEPYQQAINSSGYNYKLRRKTIVPIKKSRKRNIVWFNPPYDIKAKTNIGSEFLRIINTSFPSGHALHKLFNKNNVKLSYSCMPNMKTIIDGHNKTVLKNNSAEYNSNNNNKLCNCRQKDQCPMQGECRKAGIIYQATVETVTDKQTYIGLTENDFKTRYNNHTASFRHEKNKNATELSKYIWALKNKSINFNITWKIICHATPYSNSTKKCNLCTTEKYFIMYHPDLASLNRRCDIVSKCRHSNKYLLKNI